jgi:hypothetical protein
MANSIRTRPQRRLTQAELDAFLEKAADTLRGGVDHSESRGYVFALLFYKRINDVYLENVAALTRLSHFPAIFPGQLGLTFLPAFRIFENRCGEDLPSSPPAVFLSFCGFDVFAPYEP